MHPAQCFGATSGVRNVGAMALRWVQDVDRCPNRTATWYRTWGNTSARGRVDRVPWRRIMVAGPLHISGSLRTRKLAGRWNKLLTVIRARLSDSSLQCRRSPTAVSASGASTVLPPARSTSFSRARTYRLSANRRGPLAGHKKPNALERNSHNDDFRLTG
jgi:hypothetical protein